MGKVTIHVCDNCGEPLSEEVTVLELRVVNQTNRTIDSGEYCASCVGKVLEGFPIPIHRKMVGKAPAA